MMAGCGLFEILHPALGGAQNDTFRIYHSERSRVVNLAGLRMTHSASVTLSDPTLSL